MSFTSPVTVEKLEPRQLLAANFGNEGVTYIGATDGLFASANPTTTGLDLKGGTSAAHRDTAITLDIILGSGGGVK